MTTIVLNTRNEENVGFVLVETDSDRVIAVINPKPDEDCIGKVTTALMDEYPDTTEVQYLDIKFDDENFVTSVKLEVWILDDGEECIRDYELIKTAIY